MNLILAFLSYLVSFQSYGSLKKLEGAIHFWVLGYKKMSIPPLAVGLCSRDGPYNMTHHAGSCSFRLCELTCLYVWCVAWSCSTARATRRVTGCKRRWASWTSPRWGPTWRPSRPCSGATCTSRGSSRPSRRRWGGSSTWPAPSPPPTPTRRATWTRAGRRSRSCGPKSRPRRTRDAPDWKTPSDNRSSLTAQTIWYDTHAAMEIVCRLSLLSFEAYRPDSEWNVCDCSSVGCRP